MLNGLFNTHENQISDDVLSDTMEHLSELEVIVKEYCDMTALVTGFQWLQNPLPSPLTVQGFLTKQNNGI
jgi:hypothetical protein